RHTRCSGDWSSDVCSSDLGVLSGLIRPGNIAFSQQVKIDPQQTRTIGFNKTQFKQLLINNPKLWWPNGYGDPNLYRCELKLSVRSEERRVGQEGRCGMVAE